jgi:endonuclease/exonuclease/phosphatase (EEP) superfamily protein YafD
MQRALWFLATLAGVACPALSLVAGLWWMGGVAEVFLPCAPLVLVAASVLARSRAQVLTSLTCALLTGGWLVRSTVAPAPASNTDPDLSVLMWNARGTNARTDLALHMLSAADVDVIAVVELTPEWFDALNPALRQRGYEFVGATRSGSDGIGVWSTRALTDLALQQPMQGLARPMLSVDVQTPSGPVRTHVVHPTSPLSRTQDAAYRDFASRFELGRCPCLVVGDMNRTPWMPSYSTWARRNGLRSGNGLGPTWPHVTGPVGIRIDQVLMSQELARVEGRRLDFAGSDHRAIVTRVALVDP